MSSTNKPGRPFTCPRCGTSEIEVTHRTRERKRQLTQERARAEHAREPRLEVLVRCVPSKHRWWSRHVDALRAVDVQRSA